MKKKVLKARIAELEAQLESEQLSYLQLFNACLSIRKQWLDDKAQLDLSQNTVHSQLSTIRILNNELILANEKNKTRIHQIEQSQKQQHHAEIELEKEREKNLRVVQLLNDKSNEIARYQELEERQNYLFNTVQALFGKDTVLLPPNITTTTDERIKELAGLESWVGRIYHYPHNSQQQIGIHFINKNDDNSVSYFISERQLSTLAQPSVARNIGFKMLTHLATHYTPHPKPKQ